MPKTSLVLIFVGLLFCQSLYAQGNLPKKPEAYRFAEFGTISKVDLQSKMDAFYSLLRKEDNSQGYIINYGSAAKIHVRRDAIVKTINIRCYDCPRVTFVDGPAEPKIRTVVWIVPPDADVPNHDCRPK